MLKEPAQNVMALLPQLLLLFEIRVVDGNFKVEGLVEGAWELLGPEFPDDIPPELERPDFKADARFGGDVNPTENNKRIYWDRYFWIFKIDIL